MEWKKEILGFRVMLVNTHFYSRIDILVNEHNGLAERT
jgi:hypothetical protein